MDRDDQGKKTFRYNGTYGITILVINTGGPIDLSIVDKLPEIQAVIYMSQAGMEGGNALGLLLTGEIVPSGKLTDS